MQTNAAVAEPMVEKMKKRNETSAADRIRSYLRHPGSGVLALLTIGAAVVTFAVLIFLVAYILVKGIPYLTPSLFSLEYTSENVSLMPSLINTFIMTALSLVIAAPLGIFAAIYLVEYAKKGNKLVQVIRITAETLSGIPSIVYGLFGMLFFVTALHWGMSLLAGACTLVIMVLPLIMRTAEEALKAVPILTEKQVSDLGLVSCVQSLLSYFHQQFLESWQESSLQSDVSLEKRQHFSIHQEQLLRFRI